jgi:hypothetical protein
MGVGLPLWGDSETIEAEFSTPFFLAHTRSRVEPELGVLLIFRGRVMTKYRKSPRTSIASRVRAQQESVRIEPPEGLEICSERFRQRWDMYTAQRDLWETYHLITLHRIVGLTFTIDDQWRLFENESLLIPNRFGEQVQNPRWTVIERLLNQQSMLIRLLGLGHINRRDQSGKV